MLTASLAALAVLAAPQTTQQLNSQAVPYAAQPSQPSPMGTYQPRVLNDQDTALFRQGLAQARARDVIGTQTTIRQIGDPTARKLVEWALVDTSGGQLTYYDLAEDQRTLNGWPRADSRREAGEQALDRAGLGANDVLAFFGETAPDTVEGAIAKAGALEQSGRQAEAQGLIRDWWRTRSFDEAQQSRILGRWGPWLTPDDHSARLDMLLLGPHGPATRAMTTLVPYERQSVANAAMALRTAYDADATVAGLGAAQAVDPVIAFERARILRAGNRQSEGFSLLRYLPPAPSHTEGQASLWSERRNYFLDALERRNWQAAYDSMNGHGFPGGDRRVDADFFAGWVALTKLNDAGRAAQHFESLRTASSTPISQGRALYWLGRAAEARGDAAGAQELYRQGSQHIQTFYGQLAAEKAGMTTLTLPGDPVPSQADIQAFEANEVVRATRILGETGEQSLLRVFAYHLDDTVPNPADLAQLMDMMNGYGDGFGAMMVGRASSQRGVLMPERMYPIRVPTAVPGAAPLEFTLAITRQESSFDPRARSSADARGMMQFLTATASAVARRMGLPYSAERLWEPDYNMQLGSYHLQELTDNFGGSMLLATVGYNAGPGRARDWPGRCGDPRGGSNGVDPIDFIECAPFTETRNYMMRVMENMGVYKARLNGGSAPLTLSQDLARGNPPGPRPYAGY